MEWRPCLQGDGGMVIMSRMQYGSDYKKIPCVFDGEAEKRRSGRSGRRISTVQQDSLYKVMVQKKEIQGPPVYFTTDWEAARASVENIIRIKNRGNHMKVSQILLGFLIASARFLYKEDKDIADFDDAVFSDDFRCDDVFIPVSAG